MEPDTPERETDPCAGAAPSSRPRSGLGPRTIGRGKHLGVSAAIAAYVSRAAGSRPRSIDENTARLPWWLVGNDEEARIQLTHGPRSAVSSEGDIRGGFV